MKKKILFFTSATALLTIAAVVSFETEVKAMPGGISGVSGGATATCQNCHGGISKIVDNGGTAKLSSDIPVDGYTPGQVYNMSLTIYTQKSKGGFNLRAQNSAGVIVGFLEKQSSNAQVTDGSINGAKIGELTHNDPNISGGQKEITFKWTAPAAGTGDVSYYAAVATGVNRRTSMDSLNKLKVVFKENNVTGISDANMVSSGFSVYPTDARDHVTLSYGLSVPADVWVRLYDLQGHVVTEVFQGREAAGAHSREVNVAHLEAGSYLVWLSANGKITTERIVVRK